MRIVRPLVALTSAIVLTFACGLDASEPDKAIAIAETSRYIPEELQTRNAYALMIGVGQYRDEAIRDLSVRPCGTQMLEAIGPDSACVRTRQPRR